MRFIAFLAIEILPTGATMQFWGHPCRKVRTGLVLAKTDRAVLAEAVVTRSILSIVSLFAVTTEIATIQEAGDAGDTMIMVFNFQQSNGLRCLIKLSLFKDNFTFYSLYDPSADTRAPNISEISLTLPNHTTLQVPLRLCEASWQDFVDANIPAEYCFHGDYCSGTAELIFVFDRDNTPFLL